MHGSGGGTKSIPKVFGNIFISFIGAGVLGLPYAFKEVGAFQSGCVVLLCCIIVVIDVVTPHLY